MQAWVCLLVWELPVTWSVVLWSSETSPEGLLRSSSTEAAGQEVKDSAAREQWGVILASAKIAGSGPRGGSWQAGRNARGMCREGPQHRRTWWMWASGNVRSSDFTRSESSDSSNQNHPLCYSWGHPCALSDVRVPRRDWFQTRETYLKILAWTL